MLLRRKKIEFIPGIENVRSIRIFKVSLLVDLLSQTTMDYFSNVTLTFVKFGAGFINNT